MYDDDHQSVVDNTRRIHSSHPQRNVYYTHKLYSEPRNDINVPNTECSHVKCNIELARPVSMFNNIVLLDILLVVCFCVMCMFHYSKAIHWIARIYLGPEFIDCRCRWMAWSGLDGYNIPYADFGYTQRY